MSEVDEKRNTRRRKETKMKRDVRNCVKLMRVA